MSVATAAQHDEAIAYCRDVTRRRARNFYYGLKLLPDPQRSAMYAIYAWMRRADDLADDAGEDAAQVAKRVQHFRRLTDAALEGEPGEDDPIWHALAFAAQCFPISPEHFHAMLDGQLDDVRDAASHAAGERYQTFDDLKEYCYRVASSVGLVCIEVWGYTSDKAPMLAIERGIAFQLTNILRDFREDYDDGRVYLPFEDFARFNLTPVELRHWSKPDPCRRFVLDQVERARGFYTRSEELDALITPACQPTLWAMTMIYRGLLHRIAEHPRQLVSNRRIRLSAVQKGMIALRARWFSTSARNGFGT